MPFERPTLQEIVDRIISDYKTRVDGSDTFTRRSAFKIKGTVYAGAVHGNYGFLNYMADQLFVSTADDEYIEIHANEWGKIKKAAVKATGQVTITGTTGTTIPVNTQLISDDSIIYLTDVETTVAAGTATIDITAQIAGADGNDEGGITLTFVSPITGINTTGTVTTLGITGGLDEETASELRERTLARKRQASFGGALHDYVSWALEVQGVTRAWAFSEWQGPGTVGIAFVRDNDTNTIIPTPEQREEVYNYILQHENPLTGETTGKPIGATLYIIPVTAYTVNFNINISPNTAAIRTIGGSQLNDLLLTVGPGQELTLSQITSAIAAIADEEKNQVIAPATDLGFSSLQIPSLGTITWSDY